jgi:predicted metal-dependent hydrolase
VKIHLREEQAMSDSQPVRYPIVPRHNLDFGLDGDIPRFWFDNDPFKSRFFDAMSTLFPEGEKFFIACVRDFRDQITDPELKQQVADFTRQEGQHGMVHTRFNNRLQEQGIRVDQILERQKALMFGYFRKHCSAQFTLAQTAAAEHMTAIMAHGFFEDPQLQKADPRVRAMYAWHAVEEIEHKAVAFDVMQKVAKVGYGLRVLAMLQVSLSFPLHVFLIMRRMFKVDGFRFTQRLGLWAKGFWWLYKPGGLYAPVIGHYLAYFKPGFHPWQHGQMQTNSRWLETFERTGDPIAAGNAMYPAG